MHLIVDSLLQNGSPVIWGNSNKRYVFHYIFNFTEPIMKTQLLTVVLLLSVVLSTAFAQSGTPTKTPAIPEHPLVKTLKLLDSGLNQPQALKSLNQNFQLNEIESQFWTDDEWLPYLKAENVYQSGKRVERLEYFLSQPGDPWELSSKSIYTYDGNNLTANILQEISEGETIAQERTLYTYQQIAGQTFLQGVEYQEWDSFEDEWINSDRSTILIENGKLSEVLNEIWLDGQWESYDRYFYEESEGDIIETTQMYDTFLDVWVNYEQYIYTDITVPELYNRLLEFVDYIEDGRTYFLMEMLPDYVSYEWDEVEESWIAFDRQITEVSSNLKNGATNANSIMTQFFNEDTEEWEVFLEYVIGYADNGNPVNFSLYITEETMDEESGSVVFNYSEDYNYDENNLLETILQYGNLFGEPFKQVNDELSLVGRTLLSWGDVSTSVDPRTAPYTFRLNAAYPNPFNPSTVIPYQLAAASNVTIQVYDMLGRNVRTLVNDFMPAGDHTVRFDGSGLSSGVYMIRMAAPGLQQTRSVTLLK